MKLYRIIIIIHLAKTKDKFQRWILFGRNFYDHDDYNNNKRGRT